MKKYLEIGKIVATQGLKGEVRVEPWCDSVEILLGLDRLYFDNGNTEIKIENGRKLKSLAVLKFKGLDKIEDVQKLRGRILYADRSDIKLDDGSYFVQDLIGIRVLDIDTKAEYGELCEVSQTGANDVYHIKKDGVVYLIPAIPQVIIETNITDGIMLIRPMKGLFDDED